MKIEIWSDFVCPFCYMGKKRFELALEKFKYKDTVQIIYRSYELNPNISKDGNPSQIDSLIEKYGMSKEEVIAMLDDIVNQGKELDLEYNFEKSIATNTMDAHRLVQHAETKGDVSLLIGKIFKAHFTDGLNISDHKVLFNIANELGYNIEEVKSVLENDTYKEEVLEDELRARLVGARGVPFFVINEEYWISGAQPIEEFLQALNEVWEEKNINNLEGNVCTVDVCDFPKEEQ